MSSIPLDLQRRLEQRWAARFLRPRPFLTEKTAERQPAPTAANPGPTKNTCLNRAGVLTLEHLIPTVESAKLREADVINL
jgi:hypothetical protein